MSHEITTNNNELSLYAQKVEAEVKDFELLQRKATMMANSTLVPIHYRNKVEEKKFGETIGYIDNKNAISNCIIAIDMAKRMSANELMVMQNLIIIDGRPSWSSQWIIASINTCGKFDSLRFEVKDLGEKEVEYIEYSWENKKRIAINKKLKIHNVSCIAYATEKSTGNRLDSAKITIEMAVKEGWYNKLGSKWKTMPEVMLRYRAAAFFGKIYAPELLMGLQSVEENQDITNDLSIKFPDAINVKENNAKRPEKFNTNISDNIEIDNINQKIIIEDEAIEDEISLEIIKKAEDLFNK